MAHEAPMLLDALGLLVGLAMLTGGGIGLVEGASTLARLLGISELTIGLTVVAFGTSTPELAVNASAALAANSAIAFGNIVGSNLANTGLVIGVAALVRPLQVEAGIVKRELPLMLLATLATAILGFDSMRASPGSYDRGDGLILLLLLGAFLYYTTSELLRGRPDDPLVPDAEGLATASARGTHVSSVLLMLGGTGLLVFGGQWTVDRAVSLAEALEVSRVVIGLPVVALGTSLPELATSVVAAARGQSSLAIGNVVGSNVFNLVFILGVTATISDVDVPTVGGAADLAALVFSALLLMIFALGRTPRIGRPQGVVFVAGYLAYMTWRVLGE